MTKLDEIIKRTCPNGIRFRKIYDFVDYVQPTKYIVKDTNYNNNYKIPVLTAGQSFILGYTNETNDVYKASKESPVIIFDDFTGSFHWVDFNFKVKSSALKILVSKGNINLRYIFHTMGKINFKSNQHKRLWIGTYSQIEIPNLSLEAQGEIVRILDNFMELTTELTTELSFRKSQYNFYKESIIRNKKDLISLEELLEQKRLICVTPSFKIKRINYLREGNFPIVSQDKDLISGYSDICDEKLGKGEYVCFGDHTEIIKYIDFKFVQGADGLKIYKTTDINTKYLFYSLETLYKKHNNYERHNKYLLETKISIPSIEEQNQVVKILDSLYHYVNDLNIGLPAEIKYRQQQYEYYRDKLLTFKRLEK